MNETFTLRRGTQPLLLSLPHVGTEIPADIAAALQPRARAVEDADWHLERLYDFAAALGASVLVPRFARYVVDLNRPPEDTPMYPGAHNTGLVPTTFFTGEPLYRPGAEPDAAERRRRVTTYWRPYHDVLRGELERLRAVHGHALLWDGHSIQPELPWLFDGRLPDLNLGTADGRSCSPALRKRLVALLDGQSRYSVAVDGRFKGGHITRHYGRPAEGWHTVQMEMVWSCCMQPGVAPALAWDEARAAEVRPLLSALLQALLEGDPDA